MYDQASQTPGRSDARIGDTRGDAPGWKRSGALVLVDDQCGMPPVRLRLVSVHTMGCHRRGLRKPGWEEKRSKYHALLKCQPPVSRVDRIDFFSLLQGGSAEGSTAAIAAMPTGASAQIRQSWHSMVPTLSKNAFALRVPAAILGSALWWLTFRDFEVKPRRSLGGKGFAALSGTHSRLW